jgi:HD-GYP domain-containing protein (c-di-GMP phosphodiesterase class II)
MRTDRSYRRTLPFEVAIAELESISGSQLDPRIVRALIEVVQPDASSVALRATIPGPTGSDTCSAFDPPGARACAPDH